VEASPRISLYASEPKLSPVIPDGVMRAEGEQHADPGPREAGSGPFWEVPDSLAFGSASGMTGGKMRSTVPHRHRG
jgi:hypothetical protein